MFGPETRNLPVKKEWYVATVRRPSAILLQPFTVRNGRRAKRCRRLIYIYILFLRGVRSTTPYNYDFPTKWARCQIAPSFVLRKESLAGAMVIFNDGRSCCCRRRSGVLSFLLVGDIFLVATGIYISISGSRDTTRTLVIWRAIKITITAPRTGLSAVALLIRCQEAEMLTICYIYVRRCRLYLCERWHRMGT